MMKSRAANQQQQHQQQASTTTSASGGGKSGGSGSRSGGKGGGSRTSLFAVFLLVLMVVVLGNIYYMGLTSTPQDYYHGRISSSSSDRSPQSNKGQLGTSSNVRVDRGGTQALQQQQQQQQQQVASGSTTTNDNGGAHRLAGLSCDAYGGPHDAKEAQEEMVYWRDIPSDASWWQSPYGAVGGGPGSTQNKYLTFEPDEGGWNNIRMAMETALVMAVITGRTLVMPPEQRLYLLWKDDKKDGKAKAKNHFGLSDFFHFDSLQQEIPSLKVITFEEFLKREFMSGNVRDPKTGLPVFPPDNRTDWNDAQWSNFHSTKRGKGSLLWKWLRNVATPLNWDNTKCVAAFPSEPGQGAVNRMNETLQKVFHNDHVLEEKRKQIKPNALGMKAQWRWRIESYNGFPTPVNASVVDRLAEMLANRKQLCVYDVRHQAAQIIHVKGEQATGHRFLVHFYAFLFLENWRADLWMKRFVRDHLRYMDEIQCAAARVVREVRRVARRNGNADGLYHSMHIRRGDFQYKEMKLDAKEIYHANTQRVLGDGATVYVATDEKDKTWFKPLREHYKLVFLSDFEDQIRGINKNYYGMLDQLIASRGRIFFGAYYSTFTGYINRLRGYRAVLDKQYGYQHGVIESYYYVPSNRPRLKRIMKGYTALEQGFWCREFPVGWRDIDHDVVIDDADEEAINYDNTALQ